MWDNFWKRMMGKCARVWRFWSFIVGDMSTINHFCLFYIEKLFVCFLCEFYCVAGKFISPFFVGHVKFFERDKMFDIILMEWKIGSRWFLPWGFVEGMRKVMFFEDFFFEVMNFLRFLHSFGDELMVIVGNNFPPSCALKFVYFPLCKKEKFESFEFYTGYQF